MIELYSPSPKNLQTYEYLTMTFLYEIENFRNLKLKILYYVLIHVYAAIG